ncbi:hypothetical protein ACJX0J_013655, partial [Zea mays]
TWATHLSMIYYFFTTFHIICGIYFNYLPKPINVFSAFKMTYLSFLLEASKKC